MRQRPDDRTNDVVDVVLGPTFTRVHTRAETTKALHVIAPTLPMTCPAGVTPPTPTPTPSKAPAKKAHPTPTTTPKR
jgi:hypothetical protein